MNALRGLWKFSWTVLTAVVTGPIIAVSILCHLIAWSWIAGREYAAQYLGWITR